MSTIPPKKPVTFRASARCQQLLDLLPARVRAARRVPKVTDADLIEMGLEVLARELDAEEQQATIKKGGEL